MIKLNSKSGAIAMAIASFSAFASGCGSAPVAVAPIGAILPVVAGFGQCMPLTQSIPFQAMNLSTDNFQSVYAGNVPYVDTFVRGGGQFGQVVASPAGAIGTAPGVVGVRTIQTMANRPDGSVVMNIAPTARTGNGLITLSAAKLSIIYGLYGLNYPNVRTPYTGSVPSYGFPSLGMTFNTPAMTPAQIQAQSPCVSGIAISLSFALLVGNYISGGRVYLYLNNTQHGDYLQF